MQINGKVSQGAVHIMSLGRVDGPCVMTIMCNDSPLEALRPVSPEASGDIAQQPLVKIHWKPNCMPVEHFQMRKARGKNY